MADFHIAHDNTSTNEGVYSNDKRDRGGETYYGISRRFHPSWDGWDILDQYKEDKDFPDNIQHNDFLAPFVDVFYRENFWEKISGDAIVSQDIANYLYDVAVNKGVRSAVKYLQTGCNISNREGSDWDDILVDGLMGGNTLKALTAWTIKRGERPCVFWLFVQIMGHWKNQALTKPGQEVFINGIMDRHIKQLDTRIAHEH